MDTERIKTIQSNTAYPDSQSVNSALLQVWNEVQQENCETIETLHKRISELEEDCKRLANELLAQHNCMTTRLLQERKCYDCRPDICGLVFAEKYLDYPVARQKKETE